GRQPRRGRADLAGALLPRRPGLHPRLGDGHPGWPLRAGLREGDAVRRLPRLDARPRRGGDRAHRPRLPLRPGRGPFGRVVATGAGIIDADLLAPAIYAMAALTAFTVVQRVWHVRNELKRRGAEV